MRIAQDTAAGRRQFEVILEQRRRQETGQARKGLHRCWCCGDEAFRQELLGQMTERMAGEHYRQERAQGMIVSCGGVTDPDAQASQLAQLCGKGGRQIGADPARMKSHHSIV